MNLDTRKQQDCGGIELRRSGVARIFERVGGGGGGKCVHVSKWHFLHITCNCSVGVGHKLCALT